MAPLAPGYVYDSSSWYSTFCKS